MAWLASLPAGKLNQWLAWEQVEPMGETWMQVAKVLEALYLPIYAKAGSDAPEAADYMPERYRRPKKSVASEIRAAIESSDAIANQMKAMMGAKK
jgi:hypothetical protein